MSGLGLDQSLPAPPSNGIRKRTERDKAHFMLATIWYSSAECRISGALRSSVIPVRVLPHTRENRPVEELAETRSQIKKPYLNEACVPY
jgi:hypothetical protein